MQPWSEVRKTSGRAIQILSPAKGVATRSSGLDESSFAENWQQEVIFDLHDLQTGKHRSITSTEGRLYTFLWRGDIGILEDAEDAPPVPRQAAALKKLLPEAARLIQTELLPDPNLTRFLLPCDLSAGLYRDKDKYLKVKQRLEEEFKAEVMLEPASSLGGEPPFLPTVHVAVFSMRGAVAEQIEKVLQSVLYNPQAGRQGVSRFRLKTHGLLL